jgi:hypothetical protein
VTIAVAFPGAPQPPRATGDTHRPTASVDASGTRAVRASRSSRSGPAALALQPAGTPRDGARRVHAGAGREAKRGCGDGSLRSFTLTDMRDTA